MFLIININYDWGKFYVITIANREFHYWERDMEIGSMARERGCVYSKTSKNEKFKYLFRCSIKIYYPKWTLKRFFFSFYFTNRSNSVSMFFFFFFVDKMINMDLSYTYRYIYKYKYVWSIRPSFCPKTHFFLWEPNVIKCVLAW